MNDALSLIIFRYSTMVYFMFVDAFLLRMCNLSRTMVSQSCSRFWISHDTSRMFNVAGANVELPFAIFPSIRLLNENLCSAKYNLKIRDIGSSDFESRQLCDYYLEIIIWKRILWECNISIYEF